MKPVEYLEKLSFKSSEQLVHVSPQNLYKCNLEAQAEEYYFVDIDIYHHIFLPCFSWYFNKTSSLLLENYITI